jgi:hypothetical protein
MAQSDEKLQNILGSLQAQKASGGIYHYGLAPNSRDPFVNARHVAPEGISVRKEKQVAE